MHKNGKCMMCDKPSGKCKLCPDCRDKYRNCGAIVSQNVFKLKRLLDVNRRDSKWFNRLERYYCNIITNGLQQLEYKAKENNFLLAVRSYC